MVTVWFLCPTRKPAIARTREAMRPDGSTACYSVPVEVIAAAGRTRGARTRSASHRGQHVERVRRDWIIHWHTPDGFADLARTAALEVTRHDPIENGEFTVYLRRASTSR